MEGDGHDYVNVSARGQPNQFGDGIWIAKAKRGQSASQYPRATPVIANPMFDPDDGPGAIGNFLETDGMRHAWQSVS